MINYFYSLRFKLLVLCILSIVIPISILFYIMPIYYQNIVASETKNLTESNLESVINNINIYLDDLERVTISPYSNTEWMNSLIMNNDIDFNTSSPYDIFSAKDTISNMLVLSLQNTRKDIICGLYVNFKGNGYVMTKRNGISVIENDMSILQQKWFVDAVNSNGRSVITNVHEQIYLPENEGTKVFSVARLIKDTVKMKPLGVFMADADTNVLKEILNDVKFNVSSVILILDSENNLIYSNEPISENVIQQIKNKKEIIQDNNSLYSTVYQKSDRTNWNIVVLLSQTEMEKKTNQVHGMGMLISMITSVIVIFVFLILSKIITNPFMKILTFIKEVEKGNLDYRTNITGRDEMSQLAMSLDNMAFQLDDLIKREYKAKLSTRNAEFYALQSQINPHFLYNTLNGFLALNRMNQQSVLEKSIKSLTCLMRYTLGNNDLSTIKLEFAFLYDYCSLQKLRFEDRLDFNISYEEEVGECKIPRLILQPLVENTIVHGIEPIAKLCKITVRADIQSINGKDMLVINVEDEGCGFDTSCLDINNSIGLKNVKERIEMLYCNSTFSISSTIGVGTKAVVNIPWEDLLL